MGCTDIALTNYEKAVSLAPGNREFNIALRDFKNAHKDTAASTAAEKPKPQVNEQAVTYDSLIKLVMKHTSSKNTQMQSITIQKLLYLFLRIKLRCLKLQIYTSS